jgi:hypothetical protein
MIVAPPLKKGDRKKGVRKFTSNSWRAFLPGAVILAIGWLPIFADDLLGRIVGDPGAFVGLGLAWGLLVALPATIAGCLALVGGLFYLFLIPADSSENDIE